MVVCMASATPRCSGSFTFRIMALQGGRKGAIELRPAGVQPKSGRATEGRAGRTCALLRFGGLKLHRWRAGLSLDAGNARFCGPNCVEPAYHSRPPPGTHGTPHPARLPTACWVPQCR